MLSKRPTSVMPAGPAHEKLPSVSKAGGQKSTMVRQAWVLELGFRARLSKSPDRKARWTFFSVLLIAFRKVVELIENSNICNVNAGVLVPFQSPRKHSLSMECGGTN